MLHFRRLAGMNCSSIHLHRVSSFPPASDLWICALPWACQLLTPQPGLSSICCTMHETCWFSAPVSGVRDRQSLHLQQNLSLPLNWQTNFQVDLTLRFRSLWSFTFTQKCFLQLLLHSKYVSFRATLDTPQYQKLNLITQLGFEAGQQMSSGAVQGFNLGRYCR